jgi:hypothetical protein
VSEFVGTNSQRINVDLILSVVKLADGSLQVTLSSGAVVTIAAGDVLGERVWLACGGS